MSEQTTFRCYYEDGTIVTSDICNETSDNGSPLLKSELSIIEDVNSTPPWPYLLLIILMIATVSQKRK